MLAAKGGHLEVVKQLISSGASVDATQSGGVSIGICIVVVVRLCINRSNLSQ